MDAETGLYYYGARYYDARTSRFISADDRFDDLYSAAGLNIFSYCHNNPVRFIDPSGHDYVDSKNNNRRGDKGNDTPVIGGEFGWKPLEQGGDISAGPPGKIIGEQPSNQVIGDLARNLEQRPGGSGQKVLDEAFGPNQASSSTYCATDSLFLGIAKLGNIEPTMEGYKKFVRYAVDNNYILKRSGWGLYFEKLANDYGVDYKRTFSKGIPSPGDKYMGLLSTEGTVLMINANHHFVTSVTGGDSASEYGFDTSDLTNIGRRQRRKNRNVDPEKIDDLIVLKRR